MRAVLYYVVLISVLALLLTATLFSNITVYTYLEPLKQWSKFLSGKSLFQKRINLVLEALGLNPEVLLCQRKNNWNIARFTSFGS